MATLTNSKQIPLDQLYKVEVPRYKFLIGEYEVRKQRPSMLGKSHSSTLGNIGNHQVDWLQLILSCCRDLSMP